MSIITPRDLPTENVVGLTAEDLIEHYNSLTLQNEKIKFKNLFLKGLNLNASRIAMQELTSGSLSVSGWYTIAEADTPSGLPVISADFSILARGNSIISGKTVKVNVGSGAATKDSSNTTIEITSLSENSTTIGVKGLRLAKSDSITTAGFKLQAYFDVVTSLIAQIGISNNMATSLGGFQLVAPYLDEAPVTLPDGVTAATFLEAGEELRFEPGTGTGIYIPTNWSAIITGNDTMEVEFLFPEIPKQATGITLTYPSTSLRIGDILGGQTAVITTGFAFSNIKIDGKTVKARMTLAGAFTGLQAFRASFVSVTGTGCKITLT